MDGEEETDEQRARRLARKAKLDQAFEDYITDMVNTGDMMPGIMVGWIAGVQVTHFEADGFDRDGFLVEDRLNMNVYLARGVADATAERFQQRASGYYDGDS